MLHVARRCACSVHAPHMPSTDVHAARDTRDKARLDSLHSPAGATLLAAQMHQPRRTVLVKQRVHALAARAEHIPVCVHMCRV